MRRIKQANIVRFTERNDVRCADVEIKADGIKGILLAEFTASQDNDFDMRHVYRKDESSEIDWYDNNLHKAFKDVSEELFDNEGLETKWGEREEFKEGILMFGSIRKELEEHFRRAHTASLFHTDDVENQTFLH
ncbi:hypothetical protein SAMN04487897_10250 [Paenibacillus sp. yr247]|uniref:hypothetical protein n=1 Tax=Paenibacillus sp. yr247 TaxID=1761880 RepID=UPI00087E3BD2|nr:hypothetical protein [Paenibacillus sp. yr247]SDN18339.1 hypothetical protein SAMN04487897_10250 [Paenibacillus sp. yr247]